MGASKLACSRSLLKHKSCPDITVAPSLESRMLSNVERPQQKLACIHGETRDVLGNPDAPTCSDSNPSIFRSLSVNDSETSALRGPSETQRKPRKSWHPYKPSPMVDAARKNYYKMALQPSALDALSRGAALEKPPKRMNCNWKKEPRGE